MIARGKLLPLLLSGSFVLGGCEAPGPGASGESTVDADFHAGVPDSFTSGSGSDNYIAKWSATTSLSRSSIIDIPVGSSSGKIGINNNYPQAALDVVGLEDQSSLIIPRDTTANRPGTGVNGMLRYNTTTNVVEAFVNSAWQAVATLNTNQAFLADVTVGGAFGVTGNATAGGTLAVTGTSTLTGAVTAANGVSVTTGGLTVSAGGASVTGNSSVTGTFGVSGTSSLTGLVTAANGVSVTTGGVTVAAGGVTVTGNSTFNSAVSFGSTVSGVSVTGTSSFDNTLSVTSGGINVTGNSSVTGTFGVSAASTFSGSVAMNAGAQVSGGALALNGQNITSVGNITGNGALTVASGGAANDLALNGSGAGSVLVGNGNGTGLSVSGGANFVTASGSAGAPSIGSGGAGVSVNLQLAPKGAGSVLVASDLGVGSAVSAPATNFEVAGSGATMDNLAAVTAQVRDTTAAAAGVGGKIGFAGLDGSGGSARFAALGGLKESAVTPNNAGYLAFFTRANGGNLTEKMRIDSAGNVGIGTSGGGFLLDVNGTMRAFGITDSSDLRLKREIRALDPEDDLARLLRLRGVSYFWRDPAHGERRQIGFVAQEVEKLYPELVETDRKGLKSLAYSHLVAPLVNGLRALFARVETVAASLRSHQAELAALRSRASQAEARAAHAEAEIRSIRSWICSKEPASAPCRGR